MRIVSQLEYWQLRSRAKVLPEIREHVSKIIDTVQAQGDQALYHFTQVYDSCDIASKPLRMSSQSLKQCASQGPDIRPLLREAADNIRRYHQVQQESSHLVTQSSGEILGQIVKPMSRVGLYVPGGRAAYPSTVLMNAVPAQVAGVKEIAVATPPLPDGNIHYAIAQAAEVLGIEELYCIGGAQAIAALAFGTEQVRSVDKIVGPGNAFVTEAKRQVYGLVDIDMVAGPSEIVIIAEPRQNPRFVAADLIAQAEHDPLAVAVAVTWDLNYAHEIKSKVECLCLEAPRQKIILESLKNFGAIVLVKSSEEALSFANEFAPEHLELMVSNPWDYLGAIKNAGAIFLGAYTPESLGDYWAGPSHVLPTSGTARFGSPLGVYDFYKRSSVIYSPRSATVANADKVAAFAESEGLYAHANAIREREKND